LRSASLVRANLVMATIAGFIAFQFIATFYLQEVLEWSAIQAALAFLPGGLLIALAAPRAGALVTRLGPTVTLSAGMLAFALAYLLYLRIDSDFTYATVMLPTMLLLGVGFSLGYPAANIVATNGVADAEQGLAAGLVNTSFQLGGALILAIVTAVITSRTDGSANPTDATLLDALHPALLVIGAAALLGFATGLTGLRRSRRALP
jgi:sugar phosphate permease